jgi:hypothetical protein
MMARIVRKDDRKFYAQWKRGPGLAGGIWRPSNSDGCSSAHEAADYLTLSSCVKVRRRKIIEVVLTKHV